MDDEENKPIPSDAGATQIPLIHDLVFDPSRPLKPPRKPAATSRKRSQFPPGYDPDTADLFDDFPFGDKSPQDNVEPTAFSGDEVDFRDAGFTDIEPVAPNHRNESDKKLKAELTEALSSILEDLEGDSKA